MHHSCKSVAVLCCTVSLFVLVALAAPITARANATIDWAASWDYSGNYCPQFDRIKFTDNGAYPGYEDTRARYQIIVYAYDVTGTFLFVKNSGVSGGPSGTPLPLDITVHPSPYDNLFDCLHNASVFSYKIEVFVTGLPATSPGYHKLVAIGALARNGSVTGGPESPYRDGRRSDWFYFR